MSNRIGGWSHSNIGDVQYIIQSVCSCGEETLRYHIAKIKQSLAVLISSLTLILIEVLQYFELFPMRSNISTTEPVVE